MNARASDTSDVLDTCRRAFRDEAYAPRTWLSVGHTLKFAGIAGGLLLAQIGLEGVGLPEWTLWLIGVGLALFQGLAYQALQLIAHDCGHGSFSPHPQLNRWIGHLTAAPMLLNYAHWRRSHKLHHAHVGNIERDEAFGPKVRKPGRLGGAIQKALRGMMWVPFLVYAMQILLPFTDKLKTSGYPNYFWPSSERESWISFVCVMVHVALMVGCALAFGPAFVCRALLLPLLTAWSTFLLFTFLNHTGPNTVWYPNQIWRYRRGIHNTCNVSYGPVLNFFLLGVGTDHYAHHIQPRIPWYRLRRASTFIGDLHPNNQVFRLGFFGAWAAYARWTWMRVQHGYVTDESRPFVYPGADSERP